MDGRAHGPGFYVFAPGGLTGFALSSRWQLVSLHLTFYPFENLKHFTAQKFTHRTKLEDGFN